MKKENILLGAHISISGGLYKAIQRGQKLGCDTIQIFTKSTRRWFAKKLNKTEIEKFKETQKESSIRIVITHSSYLINIGSPNPQVEKKSILALKEELDRCEELGIPYLVLHPGSHLESSEEKCLDKISKNLNKVLETANGTTTILLENTAGQGTNVGYKFEHLAQIRNASKYKKLVGVCLDTCHAYSAGYDFGTPENYKKVFDHFKKIIGIRSLKAIHINDSKTELGSRIDRHENIGKGKIPKIAFELIMNDKRFTKVPKILETPPGFEMRGYRRDMKTLIEMVHVDKYKKSK